MKSLCLVYKSISKERKFTEHDYHEYRPRKVLCSEHVHFVRICPVFAGPVTYVDYLVLRDMCMNYSLVIYIAVCLIMFYVPWCLLAP